MPEEEEVEIVAVHQGREGTPDEVLGATTGLVYILENMVALDIKNFGRVQFPMDVADSVGIALRKGSRMLREGNAKEGVKIL